MDPDRKVPPLLRHALLSLLLIVAGASVAASAQAARPPNVLFIVVDDLSHWVGYLGRNRQTLTPNLDRLANRGVSFTHAYAPGTECNPSRTALLSGLRPATSGVYGNRNDKAGRVPPALTLTSVLQSVGYTTLGAGKIDDQGTGHAAAWDDHLSHTGQDPVPPVYQGIDFVRFAPLDCKDEDLRDGKIVEYGVRQLEARHDRPFFLGIGLHKPHSPWCVPRRYFEQHPLESIELPPHLEGDLDDVPPTGVRLALKNADHARMLASGQWKPAVQAYLAAISYADAMIGRLIDALDRSEYRDNTVICLLGDHGYHLGEKQHWRKSTLWEEASCAPLIWVAPGVTPAGRPCDRVVDFMSIYPTLMELCGVPIPAHVQGVSIRPLLADPTAPWALPALTTCGFRNHAVRTEEWRYIRYANGDEELYDERADPYEWHNLAGDPALREVKAALAQSLPRDEHRPKRH
jgi:arylsulfatase A-like enzyme